MSNTHEELLTTSADIAEEFSQAMDRMFALRMMIPAVIEEAGTEGRLDTMRCGVSSFLDGIYNDMNTISVAYWALLRSHHSTLIEQGKVEAPYRLPETDEVTKATGTNG